MPAPTEPSGDTPPVRPGRSVFDEPEPDVRRDATAVLPAVEQHAPAHARPVLDGAAFGLYEDAGPRSRWPAVLGAFLAVAVLAVGVLVWRAVNTDAALVVPSDEAPATTTPVADTPTEADVRALVPAGLGSCVSPDEAPTDGPPRAALICPRSAPPETVVFVLYAFHADREAAFDDVVEVFGVAGGSECALGHDGVHDYIGVERVGRLACVADGDVVDFVWTTDEAPLLVRARGGGSFADHYAFWDRIVERTDAGFPLAAERALLDELPAATATDCRRDLQLNVDAGGQAAVVCDQEEGPADTVSSVQFGDDESMTGWIEGNRSAAGGSVFGEDDDACTSTGFGRPPATAEPASGAEPGPSSTTTTVSVPPPPTPDAGYTPYSLGGSEGQVLCVTNPDGQRVLMWTRHGSSIASIAVADPGRGVTMRQLLAWWERGGHRP